MILILYVQYHKKIKHNPLIIQVVSLRFALKVFHNKMNLSSHTRSAYN